MTGKIFSLSFGACVLECGGDDAALKSGSIRYPDMSPHSILSLLPLFPSASLAEAANKRGECLSGCYSNSAKADVKKSALIRVKEPNIPKLSQSYPRPAKPAQATSPGRGESPVWICTPFKPICSYLHLLAGFSRKKRLFIFMGRCSRLCGPRHELTQINPPTPKNKPKTDRNRPKIFPLPSFTFNPPAPLLRHSKLEK